MAVDKSRRFSATRSLYSGFGFLYTRHVILSFSVQCIEGVGTSVSGCKPDLLDLFQSTLI